MTAATPCRRTPTYGRILAIVPVLCALVLLGPPADAGESFLHRNPKAPEAAPYGRSLDTMPRGSKDTVRGSGETAPAESTPPADAAPDTELGEDGALRSR